MLTLYHFADAVCAQKVRTALAEKKLAWEGIEVDMSDRAYMRNYIATVNANGVVPTLMVDGKPLIESNVIIEYLDDAYPEPGLKPADPFERGRMRIWMAQIDIDVHVSVNALTFAIGFRPNYLKMTPEAREIMYAAMPDPEKRWRRRDLIDNGVNSRLFEIATRRFLRLFRDMEKTLSASPWLAGETYSLADIALTPYINRVDSLGFDRLWPDYPGLRDWLARVQARDSFNEAFVKWNVPAAKARWKGLSDDAWPVVEKIVASA